MSGPLPPLDYPTAVSMADAALAAFLVERPQPTGVYTFDELNALAVRFHQWLTVARPDVLAVLESAAAFEPMTLEDYIHLHSLAYTVAEAGAGSDDFPNTRISRRSMR